MSKHTPGTWKFRTCYTKGEPVEYAVESTHPEHSGLIATVHITVDNDDEDYTNAKLIAAAPDLLAALKDLLSMAESVHEVPPTRANKARAAIAKAEGNP